MLPELDLPTLVLHARGDRMVGFEDGRKLASSIRNARLVALDSRHHILLGDEPAWPTFLQEVSMFLRGDAAESVQGAPSEALGSLTSRERDVLTLVAEGKDNLTIADELTLSTRTVERHLQNIYLKLGISGKAARAAAVARVLTAR